MIWRAYLWFFGFFVRKFFSDEAVIDGYLQTGRRFGRAVADLATGECYGFEEMFETWAFWERESARRGFGTLPIDDFVADAEGRESLNPRILWGSGKAATLHAEIYRDLYLHKVQPVGTVDDVESGRVSRKSFVPPSTRPERVRLHDGD